MDAHTIAEKLTKAQRRAVVALSASPSLARRDSFSALSAFNLVAIGVTKLGFDRGFMRDTYALTPLGIEVRNILLNGEGK